MALRINWGSVAKTFGEINENGCAFSFGATFGAINDPISLGGNFLAVNI